MSTHHHMSRRARWVFSTAACIVVAAMLTAVACRPQPSSAALVPVPTTAVTGVIDYRQGEALPTAAVVRVLVQDVSLEDAPARVVGQQTIEPSKQRGPLRFAINIPKTHISESARYIVCARIDVGDQLAYISTANYPVLTQGNPLHQDVVVDRVP